jgi:hypothetical protein
MGVVGEDIVSISKRDDTILSSPTQTRESITILVGSVFPYSGVVSKPTQPKNRSIPLGVTPQLLIVREGLIMVCQCELIDRDAACPVIYLVLRASPI